jgi:negative regulator of genetic competence, sporulation and motility
MELLVISESKLKIMLDEKDMEKYGLSTSELDYEDPPTRKKLLRILDDVKEHSGFDTAADKLLIQLYPSRDGGGELFVTKLGLLPASAEQSLKRSRGVGVFCRGTDIFFTPEFSSLLHMAKLCEGIRYIERSHLFFEEDRGYYLVLDQRGSAGTPSPLWPLYEYADRISPSRRAYIEEYAQPLLQGDAIAKLSELYTPSVSS